MLITESERLKDFAPGKRLWQGIPGVCGTKKGRLFATFYSGGVTEEYGNYALLLISDDGGASFRDPVAVHYPDDPAAMRVFDPCVWIDPEGRLWWFAARADITPGHRSCRVIAYVCDDPDAKEIVFGKEITVADGIMMNKPTVTKDGRLLLPVAVWAANVAGLRPLNATFPFDRIDRGAFVYESRDGGATFTKRGGVDMPDRSFDEHMIVEKKDGTLAMFVRRHDGIGTSVSTDGGTTWSEGVDSGLGGPDARFFIRRLASGRLLLVNYAASGRARKNLAAMLSDDDGRTWSAPLMLDERANVSYPDGFEDENGNITVIYDHERGAYKTCAADALAEAREILLCRFTEADILAGKIIGDGSFLRKTVSKLTDYDGDADALYQNR